VSLLVHVAVLLFVPQLPPQSAESGVQGGDSVLAVQLAPPDKPAPPRPPAPPVHATKPSKATPATVKTRLPRPVLATTKPGAAFVVPTPTPVPVVVQTAQPRLNPSDFPDLDSYLIAMQQIKAGGAESNSAPSAEQTRDEVIKRNLKSGGTNGIFRILRMDSYTAEFSFRGWTNDYSNARREVIEVEKGDNPDIERAIIRKMIDLIRRYYKGDFQWDSQRLHRVVTLSAKPVDNAGLEDFMMREFFQADGQLR
jgi:hypothetical protein